MKSIILVIESEIRGCPSHWKLFVAKHLANGSREVPVRVFPADVKQRLQEDSLPFRLHFRFEAKASRLNQGNFLPPQETFISKSSVKDEDLIVNLSSLSLGELRKIFPKNIIWTLCYKGHPLQAFTHIGEQEFVCGKATVDIELVESVPGAEAVCLDVARYNPHYSAVRNFQNAVYSLHLLILKNIRKRTTANEIRKADKSGGSYILSYLAAFYKHVFMLHWRSVLARINPNWYGEQWTVGISRGQFLEKGVKDLVVHPVPKGEFWADPFLYRNPRDKKLYLMVERFPFRERKGVIACGEVDDELHIHKMHDILVKPYHLSYPHLIEEDGKLYMMPESSANNRLEIYVCVEFPNQWQLYAVGMQGQSVTDTVYYMDKNGDRWLFTTESDSDAVMHCTVMNIYKIDSLALNEVTPHKQNPIIIDSSCARNGGRIFESDGNIYRVAQNNTFGEYGHGVSLRQIVKLDIESYEEVEVASLSGTDVHQFRYNHHLCQIDDAFVLDLRK